MKFIAGLRALKEEDHRRALYAALVFIMLMILFFLLVSLEEPDPPIQEDIVEVWMPEIEVIQDMGSPEAGGGPPASDPNTETHMSNQETALQDESPVHEEEGQGETDGSDPDESDVDEGLSFNPGGNGEDHGPGLGEGEGLDGGGIGNVPGGGTYNPNRKVVKHPVFNPKTQEEGKIALDIWVDATGKVVKTKLKESESTSGSAYLIKLARKAAATMKYDEKKGAKLEHVGYKVFSFRKA